MPAPTPLPTRPAVSRRVVAAVCAAAAAAVLTACGDGTDDDAGPPTTSTSVVVGPTASTAPAPTSLSESATCDEYLRATGPARENATRAALIVARRAAGVEPEPPPDVRARFEAALDLSCREQPAAPMLDVMGTVLDQGSETYLQ